MYWQMSPEIMLLYPGSPYDQCPGQTVFAIRIVLNSSIRVIMNLAASISPPLQDIMWPPKP